MRRTLACCIALLLAVSACQSVPDIQPRRVLPATHAATVATLATEEPTTSNTSSPLPSPLPSVATVTMHGQVAIDASYVLSLGRGKIIGNNGSSVLMLTGDTMLDDTDIGILSHNGGSIISQNGAGIISHNGGTIISQNGGSIISHNGGSYHVLDTTTVGDVLPAAGMGVVAISLTTGKALGPAVATDENGNYSLSIPADQQGNVLVVAQVPGHSAADTILDNPRLLYSLASSPAAKNDVLDEDTALVTRYLRLSYSNVLLQFLQSKLDTPLTFDFPINSSTQEIAQGLADQLRGAAAPVPTSALPALAERLADLAISQTDFSTTHIDASGTSWKGPDELAIPAMIEVMRVIRAAAIAKMSANPNYFDTASYVVQANSERSPQDAFHILRPSDLGDFVFETYQWHPTGKVIAFVDILKDLGVDPLENDHLISAEDGLVEQMALTLLTPRVNALIRSEIREFSSPDSGAPSSGAAGTPYPTQTEPYSEIFRRMYVQ